MSLLIIGTFILSLLPNKLVLSRTDLDVNDGVFANNLLLFVGICDMYFFHVIKGSLGEYSKLSINWNSSNLQS